MSIGNWLLILFVPTALSILVWSLYNLSVFLVGVRRYFCHHNVDSKPPSHAPFISLIVPAKDEEKVIGRLLESLLNLDYPKDRMEILIIEDGSSDRTADACVHYASDWPRMIRYFHRFTSMGKPAALNFALHQARGEIVGVLDADNVAKTDLLLRVAERFGDPTVLAIQGLTQSANTETNILTKIISLEESAWYKAVMNGKDRLGLFVPLTGSCQFIRAEALRSLGGWDEFSLAEDVELAARLLESDHRVRFCQDAVSLQEAPSHLSQLFRQRSRWYRGYIETAIKYGRLLRRPDRSRFDAELSLVGPILMSVSFTNYLLSWAVFTYSAVFLAKALAFLMVAFTSILLLAVGFALVYTVKPRKLSNFLWLPFIYVYWFLQTVIATYAMSMMLLRRPRVWMKTEKTGQGDSYSLNVAETS
jgi:cellulose synthase/poly-beta-1,6-N-acetylglucosamine synthase-like glycosyltransferase